MAKLSETPSIENKAQSIVQQFTQLKSNSGDETEWELKYEKIIQMGKSWPGMTDQDKIEDLKLKGCQSQVWLKAQLNDSQEIVFLGDSDAILVRGLVALVISVYSHERPDVIMSFEPHFLKELGLDSGLSPSRANGLFSMIKQIKYYALAYNTLTQTK